MFDFSTIFDALFAALVEALSGQLVAFIEQLFGGVVG